ncbi:Ras superfamily GTP-binding protein YlqF [Virgibacillus subterraneus]|uniref:Ribosome biogenesis GTPase A n=2 Tax=Virgibacillus TaxID=84406 RepID=A0A1H1CAC5_9BACI|nr:MULTISPECIES: ribosome biogenesis GTPase YlqF [Virgibacillus]SDQ61124.1 Ras superfamily GTP-binding protein YlqF [Virgibacillus salinus]SEQ59033.1 Ras superfamily GTP-binding protein YlqF [Virgibacillus subterraneus]
MTIQWFPGHMAKARREVEEKLKLVDFVMELVDARAPLSSQNPMLQQVLQNKPKMIVLMKRDLADNRETDRWISYFKEQNVYAIAINVNDKADLKRVIQLGKELGQEKMEKLRKKGIQPRPARAMIIGIPNVGKSTLINRLANKKIAKTGDKPGVTKHQLWIKVKKDFELLDTPGILWPKFEDEIVGYRLAAIGTIKDQLLSLQDIVAFVIKYMQEHYPKQLEERYTIEPDMEDMWEIFVSIGKQRGALESGGNVNFEKVSDLVIRDLRTGKLGDITLETPES